MWSKGKCTIAVQIPYHRHYYNFHFFLSQVTAQSQTYSSAEHLTQLYWALSGWSEFGRRRGTQAGPKAKAAFLAEPAPWWCRDREVFGPWVWPGQGWTWALPSPVSSGCPGSWRGSWGTGFPSATIPRAAPLQPTLEPLCHLLPLLHQIFHLTRSTGWRWTRPRVSLWSPRCLPGWNRCHPEGQKLKQCLWCQSLALFRCTTWIPGLVVPLRVTGSGLCTALPAPSTTAAHAGAEETPSPKNRWEHPSWKGGGTAWRDQKGKQSKEKSNVHQHSRASSLPLYHCPKFFPRNRIKTGMAENCHFIWPWL